MAKNLTEYRENVSEARILALKLLYPDAEIMTAEQYSKFESETVKEIRRKVPASEKIELESINIETGNEWLSGKLNSFEDEPQDSTKRADILNEIIERLGSLETELGELENSQFSTRTKDEDKQKLAEILKREEYLKPVEEDKSLFERFLDWVTDLLYKFFPRPDIPQVPTTGGQTALFILQLVVYGLVLGIIGFLVYRFAPFLIGRFRRKEKRKKEDRVILGEKLTADQNSSNLFSEAEEMAREGDMRGAIRKGYIALLCELSDRKIIGLSQHKTNRDYLRDVRPKKELHQNMNGLTMNFERHWYGLDAAEQSDWEEFKTGYKKAVNSER